MSEQITWTHVDKLVREQLERRQMIGTGATDAEVAYEFVKFLCRAETRLTETVRVRTDMLEASRGELKTLLGQPKSKTKQRLAVLEAAVAELRQHTGLTE